MEGGTVAGSLESVRAKLRRADEHRQSFDRLLRQFLDQHPYSIAFNFDPDTGWHDFRWQVRLAPPAEDLGLIFGDLLTSLRTTLDYLAWQLVLANDAVPTSRTEFPVVMLAHHWRGVSGDRLKGVDARWVAEIEKLQPYHRGERPEWHPLAILDHVNNINKHRTLPLTVVTAQRSGFWIDVERMAEGHGLEFQSFADVPIEDGASAFRFRWIEGREQLHVNMNEEIYFRVSFGDGLGFDWTNDQLFEWVTETVAIFEPPFGG
jgi:hypothetical protein